jgi:hypothetical protein
MMNDFLAMKAQMQQLMESIKQKDEMIAQQNLKLTQFTNGMGVNTPQQTQPQVATNTQFQQPGNPSPQQISGFSAQNAQAGQTPSQLPPQNGGFQPQQPFGGYNQMNNQFGNQIPQNTSPPGVQNTMMPNQAIGQLNQAFNNMPSPSYNQPYGGYPQQFMQMPNYR